MRDLLRQFMLYSRAERRAIVALTLMIIVVLIVPKAYRFYIAGQAVPTVDSTFSKEVADFQRAYVVDSTSALSDISNDTKPEAELFYFDPNTIGIADWLRLGLSEKQAAVIEKYKAKGGKFYKPDDLRKIYVLSDALKDKLVPYVQIEKDEAYTYKEEVPKAEKFYSIEINTADSAAFEELRGIGPARASRMVKYRNMLGGYVRVEQIAEVYGMPDSVYEDIKPHLTVNPALVKKIDVNEADYETLRKHPYIHAKIARAIIDWRGYNGKFETVEQLKEVKAVNETVYERILPYVRVE